MDVLGYIGKFIRFKGVVKMSSLENDWIWGKINDAVDCGMIDEWEVSGIDLECACEFIERLEKNDLEVYAADRREVVC